METTKPKKQVRLWIETDDLIILHKVKTKLSYQETADALIRLGLKADKAGKGGKKK